MDRMDLIAANAAKIGFEINRVLLGLHLLWWFLVDQGFAHVFGVAAVLASLGLAYVCESLRMWGSRHAERFAAGSAVATVLSASFWLYSVT